MTTYMGLAENKITLSFTFFKALALKLIHTPKNYQDVHLINKSTTVTILSPYAKSSCVYEFKCKIAKEWSSENCSRRWRKHKWHLQLSNIILIQVMKLMESYLHQPKPTLIKIHRGRCHKYILASYKSIEIYLMVHLKLPWESNANAVCSFESIVMEIVTM